MNYKAVLGVLGSLFVILAACLLAPLLVALVYDWGQPHLLREALAILLGAALSGGAGHLLLRRFKEHAQDVGRREGFAIVTFAWLGAVLFGMVPFLAAGTCGTVTDAFFETMSGVTTTGASVFGSPGREIEAIPKGLQFWRCMTQWLGGMGIVVLSVALLNWLGVGGYRMLKAETPGGVVYERDQPRITDAAKDLWKLYIGLSLAEVVLLLVSGTSVYDAFCHAFTTMSTGGFSPHGESVAYFGAGTQWVIIAFMFIAGINFSLHAQLLRGRLKAVLKNAELRLYVGIAVVCSALGILMVGADLGWEQRIRDVVFQVVAIGTTTGYATADYDAWPQLMRLLLFLLMFVGGCMGSTGGGMKVARFLIYGKALVRELHRPIYPHAVRPLRVGDRVLDPEIVANILAFGILYVACYLVGVLVMAACGYDLVTSASTAVAAISNIGPGLAQVGPMANWGHLPDVAKWVMSFLMLIGRLELFSVLILLTPWAWKR